MAEPGDACTVARHQGSGRISAMFPMRVEMAGGARLQLIDKKGKSIGDPVAAMVRPTGDSARLRARIDPRLPPGTYAAELSDGGETHRITVVVDPLVSLRVDPPGLRLEGAPGGKAEAQIMIANQGNIPADLPEYGAVGVSEVGGIEAAIGHAYRRDAEDGLQTLSRFIEELRDHYGGLIRLRLNGGAGALDPGCARPFRVTAELPDKLRPGRPYTGVWQLLDLNYFVRIEVTEPSTTGSGARNEQARKK